MFAVIFEVQPKSDRWDQYLDLAKMLKPELEGIEGFIDNERFKSARTEGRLLSLSTWADEKAVIRWRTHAMHHAVQEKGRFEVFEDYHLRVGEIVADTHVPAGETLREQRFDETRAGAAKAVTIAELSPAQGSDSLGVGIARLPDLLRVPPVGSGGVSDVEAYASIYNAGKLLLLVSWRDAAAAAAWRPPQAVDGVGTLRCRGVRVIRDYGLADRREAPQYYPPVERGTGR